MSAGKNPYARYQIINACFTNKQKPYWTKEELIRKLAEHDFDVSERTLNTDFQNMRGNEQLGFFAPITYCVRERGYYYSDPNYSIYSAQLSDSQLQAFSSVVDLLQGFRGLQMVTEFEGAIEKIVRGVDQLRRDKLTKGEQTIEFERAPYYKGMVWFDTIKNSIDNKQPLRIGYKKFTSGKEDVHIFHPYFLKEFKGRWYALGHSEKRRITLTLALDRIESASPERVPYKPNTFLKAKEYFKNTIGITHKKKPVEDIVLWFSPAMGNYIKTQHIHPSQQIIRDDEEGLVISLKLIINYELIAMLLGYCPDVSVIAPVKLKDKLEELLMKGIEANRRKVRV